MPKPVKKGTTKAGKRPSSDPMTRARQLMAEHMAKADNPAAPWNAKDGGTLNHADLEKIEPLDVTPAQLKQLLSEHMRQLGSKGGKVSGAKRMQMPVEERRRIASVAARAMWARKKAKKVPN